jgi:hypothetical protein
MADNVKPILFSTPMVQAIRREIDPKTMTRRVINPQPTHMHWNTIGWAGWDDGHGYKVRQPYQQGDILWVRETWCNINKPDYEPEYCYFSDAIDSEDYDSSEWKWRPSIFMPKEACRTWLRVMNVRPERVQDISEADAKAEGILSEFDEFGGHKYGFRLLWDSLNAKRGYPWSANNWVWVYTFERCKKPEGWPEVHK